MIYIDIVCVDNSLADNYITSESENRDRRGVKDLYLLVLFN